MNFISSSFIQCPVENYSQETGTVSVEETPPKR